MLGRTLVVVSDAHLGGTPPAVEAALLDFLEEVPSLGDALLINGDLFEFWFSYARVIPRHGFHVAAALARLRRRLPIVMVGGNHDRWDRHFWHGTLDIAFHRSSAVLEVGSRRVLAIHGDGLTDDRWSARLVHRVIGHPWTAAAYRALHPDWGFRLVERLAPRLGDKTHDESVLAAAQARQQAWAERALAADPALGAVVMGHTHRPVLAGGNGQLYLNPGAWFDAYRYAVLTESGAELRRFRS